MAGVEVDMPVLVAAGVKSSALSPLWRARRAEAWSGCVAGCAPVCGGSGIVAG